MLLKELEANDAQSRPQTAAVIDRIEAVNSVSVVLAESRGCGQLLQLAMTHPIAHCCKLGAMSVFGSA